VAVAAPRRPAPRKPVPAEGAAASKATSVEAELRRLDDEYSALSRRKAYSAAARVARGAFELQVEATGLASARALDRMRTLVSALGDLRDIRGEMALENQRLAATETLYGAESREVLEVLGSLYMNTREGFCVHAAAGHARLGRHERTAVALGRAARWRRRDDRM
jgi:hypothetical protein